MFSSKIRIKIGPSINRSSNTTNSAKHSSQIHKTPPAFQKIILQRSKTSFSQSPITDHAKNLVISLIPHRQNSSTYKYEYLIKPPTPEQLKEGKELYDKALPNTNEEAVELLTKSAYLGYPNAHLELAKRYLNGTGVPQNEQEAQHWLDKLEGQRIPESKFLAAMFFFDMMVPYRKQKLIDIQLKELAEKPDPTIVRRQNEMLIRENLQFEWRTQRYHNLLRECALEKHPGACIALGKRYYNDRNEVVQATLWMKEGIKLGSRDAEQTLSEWKRNYRYWVKYFFARSVKPVVGVTVSLVGWIPSAIGALLEKVSKTTQKK